MKLKPGTAALLLSIILYFVGAAANAQVVTEGPDSVRVPVPEFPADTAARGFFLTTWDKPSKAALFSAVLPGLGQAYNKAYWKIPIIYAAGAALGYFIIDNNNKYQDYRQALLIRNDNDSTTFDKYANSPVFGVNAPYGKQNLHNYRDGYRRNRDLTILLSLAAWGLNVAEAYVHAHMKDFDVSDNLSLRVQPDMMPVPGGRQALAPGFTFILYTKQK